MSVGHRSKSLLTVLTCGALASLCVGVLTLTGVTRDADNWFYDILLTQSNRPADDRIVIVAIDDKSLAALGRWPWPRRIHAGLLERLRQAGTRGVAFDILFSEPDTAKPASDAALVEAVQRHGRVVLPVIAEPSEPGGPPIEVLPFPALSAVAAGLGQTEIEVDPDGVVRSAYLHAGLGDARWPVLALALAEIGRSPGQRITLPGLRSPDAASASPQQWHRDYRVQLPYVTSGRGFYEVSYVDVMRGAVPDALLRDRLLLVGMTAAGTDDMVQTPMLRGGDRIAGIEYQANLLDTLLRGDAIVALTLTQQAGLGILAVLLPVWLLLRGRSVRTWWIVPVSILVLLAFSALLLSALRLWFAPMPAVVTLTAASAIWALYRMRQSQRQAHSDSLTNLANRRLFDTMLDRELISSRRNGVTLSLLLIDVDHFKHYNDHYGHRAGDEVLLRVAQAIAAHARRPRDLAARYGGDEMVAVLPETDGATAQVIADAIVDEVRAQATPHAGSDVSSIVTVSIGVASSEPRDENDADELIERADVALYRAKELGRNRSHRHHDGLH